MSQGIEEIRHFQKSLGISGNGQAIEEIDEFCKNFHASSILGNNTTMGKKIQLNSANLTYNHNS